MIKRTITLLLSLLFLFTSMGFTMHFHYCAHKSSSESFSFNKKHCCLRETHSYCKCCSDKAERIKFKGKYFPAKSVEINSINVAFAQTYATHFDTITPENIIYNIRFYHRDFSSQPVSIPLFIFDRSILI